MSIWYWSAQNGYSCCELKLNKAIICKATTVTHTKRIDRNSLRKETSFVCSTSSVLRKSSHMRQKKKLRTVAKIKTQDYKNWRLQNFFTNCNSSTKHSYNTVQRTQIATAIRHFWLTKHTHRVSRGFCLRRSRALQQTVTCRGKKSSKPTLASSGGTVKKFTLQLRYNKLFSFFMLKISSNNS